MKKFKTAFSLAELLIVMAIIGVVATMGVTISKQGIQKAYNLYFYTGYEGLIDGAAMAVNEGYDYNSDKGSFVNYITSLMSADANTGGLVIGDLPIERGLKTKNGIVLGFTDNTYTYQDTVEETEEEYTAYEIILAVPGSKKGSNNKDFTRLLYLPDFQRGLIVPLPSQDSKNEVSLLDRADILPVYIDDGLAGKVVPPSSGIGVPKYQKPEYLSYREAFCKLYGPLTTNDSNASITCDGISKDSNLKGFIQTVSPQKVF